jgi:hypothetical protein
MDSDGTKYPWWRELFFNYLIDIQNLFKKYEKTKFNIGKKLGALNSLT